VIKVKPMELEDQYREHVLTRIIEVTPQKFWRGLADRAQFTYGEAFAQVEADASLVDDQRHQKLFQERFFRMEHALMTAASDAGVPGSSKLIGANQCWYVYAATGGVGMTQNYVPVSGEMPTPAAFRKNLAKVANLQRQSRLDLGDETVELVLPKETNGIVLHSPAGRAFSEAEQKLGAIGFFVPYADYSKWAVQLPLIEILSAYKPIEGRQDKAAPIPKKAGKDDKTGTGA
jgi:hypothetical protein